MPLFKINLSIFSYGICASHDIWKETYPCLWFLLLKVRGIFQCHLSIYYPVKKVRGRSFSPFLQCGRPGWKEVSTLQSRSAKVRGVPLEHGMWHLKTWFLGSRSSSSLSAHLIAGIGNSHVHSPSALSQGLFQTKQLLGAHFSISTLGWQLKMTLR